MFKAMHNLGGEALANAISQSKTAISSAWRNASNDDREVNTYLVKGDYNTGEDIGVIAVSKNRDRHMGHHWVHFPDGQLRRCYESRVLSAEDYDMFVAFNMVPSLKVTYRPISRVLAKYFEMVLIFWFLCLAVLLIDGLIFVSVEQFFSKGVAMLQSYWGNLFHNILFAVFGVLSVVTGVCCIGSRRFERYTKDDIVVREWQEEQRRKEQSNEGWI